MKTCGRLSLPVCAFVLCSQVAFAQLSAPTIDPVVTEVQAVTIFGNESPAAVTGASYSAIEGKLYSQRQPDGTYKDRSLITTHIYRDSHGRTRAESYSTSYLPGAGEPQLMHIIITDPLAGVLYRLDSANHIATRGPSKVNTLIPSTKVDAPEQLASTSELQLPVRTVSLGTSTMDGLIVEGTRQTLMVPVGVHDNPRPFEVVVEKWISLELKVAVFSRRDNSIVGIDTTRLTKIDRSEPDPVLFQVPSDYTIEDAPAEGHIFTSTAP